MLNLYAHSPIWPITIILLHVSLNKMTFVLFLKNKVFVQLTLLLHPVDESTNFLDLSLKTIEQNMNN